VAAGGLSLQDLGVTFRSEAPVVSLTKLALTLPRKLTPARGSWGRDAARVKRVTER
jgi:hypothetical protein